MRFSGRSGKYGQLGTSGTGAGSSGEENSQEWSEAKEKSSPTGSQPFATVQRVAGKNKQRSSASSSSKQQPQTSGTEYDSGQASRSGGDPQAATVTSSKTALKPSSSKGRRQSDRADKGSKWCFRPGEDGSGSQEKGASTAANAPQQQPGARQSPVGNPKAPLTAAAGAGAAGTYAAHSVHGVYSSQSSGEEHFAGRKRVSSGRSADDSTSSSGDPERIRRTHSGDRLQGESAIDTEFEDYMELEQKGARDKKIKMAGAVGGGILAAGSAVFLAIPFLGVLVLGAMGGGVFGRLGVVNALVFINNKVGYMVKRKQKSSKEKLAFLKAQEEDTPDDAESTASPSRRVSTQQRFASVAYREEPSAKRLKFLLKWAYLKLDNHIPESDHAGVIQLLDDVISEFSFVVQAAEKGEHPDAERGKLLLFVRFVEKSKVYWRYMEANQIWMNQWKDWNKGKDWTQRSPAGKPFKITREDALLRFQYVFPTILNISKIIDATELPGSTELSQKYKKAPKKPKSGVLGCGGEKRGPNRIINAMSHFADWSAQTLLHDDVKKFLTENADSESSPSFSRQDSAGSLADDDGYYPPEGAEDEMSIADSDHDDFLSVGGQSSNIWGTPRATRSKQLDSVPDSVSDDYESGCSGSGDADYFHSVNSSKATAAAPDSMVSFGGADNTSDMVSVNSSEGSSPVQVEQGDPSGVVARPDLRKSTSGVSGVSATSSYPTSGSSTVTREAGLSPNDIDVGVYTPSGSGGSPGRLRGSPKRRRGPIPSENKSMPQRKPEEYADAQHSWSGMASTYQIRGKNYLKDRKKIPSQPPHFECVATDVINVKQKIPCYAEHPKCYVQGLRDRGDKRFFFVVNWTFEPHQLVQVFAAPEGKELPSIFRKFISATDEERNKRFKVIPNVIDGPWLIKASVGTVPAIIGKKLTSTYFQGEDFFEISCDVFSSMTAKGILSVVQGGSKKLVLEIAYLVEAQHTKELPEEILGGFRLMRAALGQARKIRDRSKSPVGRSPNGSKGKSSSSSSKK